MAVLRANGTEVARYFRLDYLGDSRNPNDAYIVEYSVRSNKCILTRTRNRNEYDGRIRSTQWRHFKKFTDDFLEYGDSYKMTDRQIRFMELKLQTSLTEPNLPMPVREATQS